MLEFFFSNCDNIWRYTSILIVNFQNLRLIGLWLIWDKYLNQQNNWKS